MEIKEAGKLCRGAEIGWLGLSRKSGGRGGGNQEAEELEAQPRKTLRAAMEAVLQPGEKEDATRR